jgi:hypothetical protein
MYTWVNVWKPSGVVIEEEFCVSEMKFNNGLMWVNGKDYAIKIMGSSKNKITGYIEDAGDGLPRILTDYRGMENQWTLDDVMFVE